MNNEVLIALVSGFGAAAITSFFGMLINNKNIVSQNIIQERAKWRNDIRELSTNISFCIINEKYKKLYLLKNQLQLKLNPNDIEDMKIVKLIETIILEKGANNENVDTEFTERISQLLKHDWDRAKLENTLISKFFNKPIRTNISLEKHIEIKNNVKYILPWIILILISAGVIFVFSAAIFEPFQKIVNYMTNNNTYSPIIIFKTLFFAVLFGIIWLGFYIVFKISEKKIIEYYQK